MGLDKDDDSDDCTGMSTIRHVTTNSRKIIIDMSGLQINTDIKHVAIKKGSTDMDATQGCNIKEEIVSDMSHESPSDYIKQFVPEPITPGGNEIGNKKQPSVGQFKPDELRQALMPTFEKLYRQYPESLPFRQPVDPQTLNIPDYFDIVKKPMDLSTIKQKLNTEQYSNPWEYVDDISIMFENCWLYNRETSKVYKYCTKLSEIFKKEIDPVMRTLGC